MNVLTDECYVGGSKDVANRWAQWKHWLKNDTVKRRSPLAIAVREHGIENFTFSLIEECDQAILRQREQHHINLLNPAYNVINVIRHQEQFPKGALGRMRIIQDVKNPTGRPTEYPFGTMKLGQLFTIENTNKRNVQRMVSYYRKKLGRDYLIAKHIEPTTLTVVRIK